MRNKSSSPFYLATEQSECIAYGIRSETQPNQSFYRLLDKLVSHIFLYFGNIKMRVHVVIYNDSRIYFWDINLGMERFYK